MRRDLVSAQNIFASAAYDSCIKCWLSALGSCMLYIMRIQSEVPSLKVNAWYLDDGTQASNKVELQRVVDIIREEGPARGLHLSTSTTVHPPTLPKSTVWFPHQATRDDHLERGIPSINDSGVDLLCTPVEDQAFTEKTIRKRLEKIRQISDKLPQLQDAHTEFSLLRSCLSLPKVMYCTPSRQQTSHHSKVFGRSLTP